MCNSERNADIRTVNQHVRQTRSRTRHRRTEPVAGSIPQGRGDLGGGRSSPATGERVDSPIDAAVTDARNHEAQESVVEIAHQVRGNGFDIPPRAQALRGQLVAVEAVDQGGNRAPFVADRRENLFAVRSTQTHSNTRSD